MSELSGLFWFTGGRYRRDVVAITSLWEVPQVIIIIDIGLLFKCGSAVEQNTILKHNNDYYKKCAKRALQLL